VKVLFLAAVCGTLTASLAGCGSSAPPPLAIACTTRPLTSGLVRTRVTVSNTTQSALRAIVYGPALAHARFIRPRYRPTNVYVEVGKERRPYVGFVIPSVGTKHPAHIEFHLAGLAKPQPILASVHSVVQADDWDSVLGSGCSVK
jgi:hypothetical protein